MVATRRGRNFRPRVNRKHLGAPIEFASASKLIQTETGANIAREKPVTLIAEALTSRFRTISSVKPVARHVRFYLDFCYEILPPIESANRRRGFSNRNARFLRIAAWPWAHGTGSRQGGSPTRGAR